ncbi:MAG TPA: hypothetical protein VE344_09395 [Methylomirabilota bacterium]|nr:hypothetical protein [Methylomirabilota bacterium]
MPYQNISAQVPAADVAAIKAAVKTTPGLKPVADQLGERFQKTSAAKAAPASAPK